MRILIADDHALYRHGIRLSLEMDGRFAQIDEAGTGKEVIRLLKLHKYSLLLLDISMEEMDGMEVLQVMKSMQIDVPTLMVSFHGPETHALQSLRAGAMGYITKGAEFAEYMVAVNQVLDGKKYLPQEFMEDLAFQDNAGHNQLPHERLSGRELQVMLALAKGDTLREIGNKTSISEKTVSTYRTRILQKMNLRNNVELARYAFAHKLIQ